MTHGLFSCILYMISIADTTGLIHYLELYHIYCHISLGFKDVLLFRGFSLDIDTYIKDQDSERIVDYY